MLSVNTREQSTFFAPTKLKLGLEAHNGQETLPHGHRITSRRPLALANENSPDNALGHRIFEKHQPRLLLLQRLKYRLYCHAKPN